MKCKIPKAENNEWKCDGEATRPDGMCDSCRDFGWITDPMEVAEAIANDPLLKDKIGIVAPLQPEDL